MSGAEASDTAERDADEPDDDAPEPLRPVPVFDVGTGGAPALLAQARAQADGLLEVARNVYTTPFLRWADGRSRRWLARTGNPYFGEIAAMAATAGRPGVAMLNLSYEWACTSAAGPDPRGDGARLLRALDWGIPGLGAYLVIARHDGPAGSWTEAVWPGYAGTLTACAPGRFAAAINQPPPRPYRIAGFPLPFPIGWLIERMAIDRRGGLPPSHVLRHVFETAPSFDAARRMIAETPVCMPAIFTLCGCTAEEACVIERLEDRAAISDGPVAAANHWLTASLPGRPRRADSHARRDAMTARMAGATGLDWLVPPILNHTTRVAVEAVPATGRFLVQGFEDDGAVTSPTLA